MIYNFKNWKLKNKILVICLVLSIIPIIILGLFSYNLASNALYDQIKEKLDIKVEQYYSLITTDYKNIQSEVDTQKNEAKNIISQQGKILIQLFKSSRLENDEKLKNIISRFIVGKTGYIYILDYNGRYILSKDRLRDGEDISNSKDESGRLYIRDIVSKGLVLSEDTIDYDTYLWKNVGEASAREKIAAIIHVPERKWIVGVSAYYDDLVDINIEKNVIEGFKTKLKAEKIGKDGYMYVINGKGEAIMHPDKEGQSLYEYDFIKKMCQDKSKNYIKYPWEGKPKVVSYNYFQQKDWIIAAGSYLSDFTAPLVWIQSVILIVVILSIVSVIVISLLFSGWIYKSLNITINSLNKSSEQIITATNQLSNASQEIANGSSEQASSIEETTASMEEITSMIKQNSINAKEANNLAEKASNASENGYGQMEKMLESMNEINKSSDHIKKIIKVIDDIAFQTNILALNAAVEAGRAGEAGMGFAVVADEVKNLANKSADAAKETSIMIEESIKRIDSGLQISTKLAEIFKEILTNTKKVSEMVREVESSSKQQDLGIDQINKAILQLDEVVQANASSAEETAGASEELLSQTETLNDIVKQLTFIIAGYNKANVEQALHKIEYRHEKKETTQVDTKQKQLPHKVVKKKEVKPEKIIPFEEDEEFKNIS